MNKKTLIIFLFGGVIVVALVVYGVSSLVSLVQPPPTPIFPKITQVPLNTTPIVNPPKSTLLLPTATTGGVDVNAPTVEQSINEIEKIKSLLPYSQTITLSGGQSVDIIISTPDASRPWVLPVFIGGIDYQAPTGSQAYNVSRNSFREAVREVFEYLSSHGVNTSLLFINWGDRTFIQERAEEWLRN